VSETLVRDDIVAAPEVPAIGERVVVAPCAGRFQPFPPDVFTTDGEWIEPGQAVGEITVGDERVVVSSPHRGWMMGMLAIAGQPVQPGEALFWVRSR
jgi:hypothetical protein